MAKKRQGKTQSFSLSDRVVEHYARQIRGVAREIGRICAPLTMAKNITESELQLRLERVSSALSKYEEIVQPWAEVVAERTIVGISERNLKLWRSAGRTIRRQIATGFGDEQVRIAVHAQIASNVKAIKSIVPTSRDRVARLVRKGLAEGRRANDIAVELMTTQDISANKAMLIARTELSKASTEITRIRAVGFNSPGYIWRTSMDGAVRGSHASMEGTFVPWNSPPTLDGMTGHAGEFPNCRCYPEVVMPAEEVSVSAKYGAMAMGEAA